MDSSVDTQDAVDPRKILRRIGSSKTTMYQAAANINTGGEISLMPCDTNKVNYRRSTVGRRTAFRRQRDMLLLPREVFMERKNNIIIDSIREEREYQGLFDAAIRESKVIKPQPIAVTGLCEGARTALLTSLASDYRAQSGVGALVIVPDEREASRLQSACGDFGCRAAVYPYRDFVYHNMTVSHELEYERLGVLRSALLGDCDMIITTPDAALQYTMPPELLASSCLRLAVGCEIERETLISFLLSAGYVRVEMVEGAGQFSVRGDIVDIYSPGSSDPIRIQFFDREIEDMEYFDTVSQRRTEHLSSIELTPAREILIPDDAKVQLRSEIEAQSKRVKDDRVRDMLLSELETLSSDREIGFRDKYISVIYPERTCLLDYISSPTLCCIVEENAVRDRLKACRAREDEMLRSLISGGEVYGKHADYAAPHERLDSFIRSMVAAYIDTFMARRSARSDSLFSFTTKNTVCYGDNRELLLEDVRFYLRHEFRTVILCESSAMQMNTAEMLREEEIPAAVIEQNSPMPDDKRIVLVVGPAAVPGFELTASRFALLSMYESAVSVGRASTSHRTAKTRRKSARERIMSYADLTVGDYVVHDIHGIGRFMGLENITHDGVTEEYAKLVYADDALLYIPTDKLDMLSKYIGARGEDDTVRLSKLGGREWGKAKAKAKAATREMAKELIALYAERKRRPGHAFPADDDMQRQFESAFEYEETDGQIAAVTDIKRDMEDSCPMDRLLCGDVGFGKTEVALRAAFKAVSDGKQAAILVPTTILAMQHYRTILSRMRGFPVHIDVLSRFRTPREQEKTLAALRRGEIDIIVGTHRLISKDVQFHDLGLLIVDEEQRFGVAQKEKLKQLSGNVDVLTLTATPIPRTLNMAMSGIRDMSILEEAPGDRLPVQTFVLEYDEVVLADAVRKELHRGGQVIWLHNRVETIEQTCGALRKLIPEARISFAHGKMDREQISDIWSELIRGEIDVLISTAIIETGVDVPNANTLIVERADRLGLSQLHQLRGRIGRSSRRAYAYFTYPRGSVISEIADKRLEAVRDYSEFGSGFKIALRDLELRGAGNLLGAEQHGQIDSVGYDMYMKLLNEAILEEKGEEKKEKPACTVTLAYDAYLPESYIGSQAQRIDAYKKIALIERTEDYDDIFDELSDRYGEPPIQAKNLLRISLIRALSSACGMSRVEQKNGGAVIVPRTLELPIWAELSHIYSGKLLVSLGSQPYVTYRIRSGIDTLEMLCEIFAKYIQIKEQTALKSADD